jgi:hypothetical protein
MQFVLSDTHATTATKSLAALNSRFGESPCLNVKQMGTCRYTGIGEAVVHTNHKIIAGL